MFSFLVAQTRVHAAGWTLLGRKPTLPNRGRKLARLDDVVEELDQALPELFLHPTFWESKSINSLQHTVLCESATERSHLTDSFWKYLPAQC